ncbi:MAG: hypothetical protein JXR59_03640 [Desulfuromonadaceae bacterium]|nr:hypothetical protein [Desulfuromonadaceae bacterium]
MDERRQLIENLNVLEQKLKDLCILYEQYFAGVERRAPMRERDDLERLLRRAGQRNIIQTELRYRLQNLSSRFYSYMGMWERVQREIDEGRYHRHVVKPSVKAPQPAAPVQQNETDLYWEYLSVCKESSLPATIAGVDDFKAYLDRQRRVIHDKYGDVDCSFRVVNEDGKPKIKVSLKRS